MSAPAAGPDPVAIPRARGGWWHEYVCPVHHTELLEPTTNRHGAAHHPCPHGCQLTGEPYASAWLVLEHQRNARWLRLLARRAEAGDRPAASAAIDLLEGYAKLYDEIATQGWHDGTQSWMLGGKLFHQALTEALWATSIANGVWTLAGVPDVDLPRVAGAATPLLAGLRTTVRDARRELVHSRGELHSNYTAWLNAADALAGGALQALGTGDADPEGWRDGPEGLYAHVRASVLDDGWEWEAATYYHGFVARAYLYTLRGSDPADLPGDVRTRIVSMLEVVDHLATAEGALPALHDSPYHRPPGEESLAAEHRRAEARETVELAHLGRQFVDLPGLARVERHAGRLLPDEAVEDRLPGWFSGPPLAHADRGPLRSHLFRDAGYAVLRPEGGATWQAVVDFGPHGGSHGHLDKLALYLYGDETAWQPDPGVVPYASRLRAEHYRTTAAHPTVRIDGEDQAECAGEVERWVADGGTTTIVASTADAYPGVTVRRHVVVHPDHLVDVVDVACDRDRTMVLQFRPDVEVGVERRDDHWVSSWHGAAPLTAVHLAADGALEACPGFGPADDPQRTRTHLDWRVTGRVARFISVFVPGETVPWLETAHDGVTVHTARGATTTLTDPADAGTMQGRA